jgi:predicted dehydrogenase
MSTHSKLSRRSFIQRSGLIAATAVAAPNFVRSSVLGAIGRTAANSRINIGVIGTGNQGTNDIHSMIPDERVQITTVCDVNRESAGYWDGKVAGREPARRFINDYYAKKSGAGSYKGCDALTDFRELLARKDIDAVMIAVPDHWHALLAVEACKAGKDVYCQKPLGLTIADGRAISDAVRKYKTVFQTGSQQRSDAKFRKACELVRNGRIGKLQTVKVGLPGGRVDFGKTGGHKLPEPVPEGFDYNFWLGPAPLAPYAPARCHVNFRWILDYSGGQVTDWGGHHPDIAQWGMNTEKTGPVLIRHAKGVFPPDPLWNTATEFNFDAVYKNGVVMNISDKNRMGVTFEGSEGKVFVTRGKIESDPASLVDSEIGADEIHLYKSDNHFRNFVDCILSRKEPIAPAETAHRSITICHLGNIAMRLGRDELKWNPDTEEIGGDEEAAKMLKREYRAPWKLVI